MNICVVGYGYWGPKLVRNFRAAGATVSVCDAHPAAETRASRDFPGIATFRDINWALREGTEAVVIATPPASHEELIRLALNHNKHVLVEKPMTLTANEATLLRSFAHRIDRTLMVDHTFLYHPAVKAIKSAIDIGDLGELKVFESTRVNLGLVQKDCDVLWDLAVHDVSILLHLVKERPVSVTAAGRNDSAVMSLNYASGLFASITVSWRSPVKVRRMMLAGDKAVVWDDTNVAEPVKLYDSGIDFDGDRAAYRAGSILSPKLESGEALLGMAKDFLHCCKTGDTPVSSSALARDVVYVLQQAQKSLQQKSTEQPLTFVS
jgi:predicted dehydrogenase